MEQKADKRAIAITGSSTGRAPSRVRGGFPSWIHCNELNPGSGVPKRGSWFYFCRIWGQELGRVVWLLWTLFSSSVKRERTLKCISQRELRKSRMPSWMLATAAAKARTAVSSFLHTCSLGSPSVKGLLASTKAMGQKAVWGWNLSSATANEHRVLRTDQQAASSSPTPGGKDHQ